MNTTQTLNANQRIKRAQLENEARLLELVKRANDAGALFDFWGGASLSKGHVADLNAMERLEKAGKIVPMPRRGRRDFGWKLAGRKAPTGGWRNTDWYGRLPGDRYYLN